MLVMAVTDTKRRTPIHISPGTGLAGLRVGRGYSSQELFSNALEDVLMQKGLDTKFTRKLVSELEGDKRPFSDLTLAQYEAMLDVLRVSPAEFEAATGVKPLVADEDLPGMEAYHATFGVPHAGDISKAFPHGELIVKPNDPLSIDLDRFDPSRQLSLENLVAFRVDDDVLVSEGVVRAVAPPCDLVIEMGATPVALSKVVLWLPSIRAVAIALYGEEKTTILRSYRAGGPVFRLNEYEHHVRGVVRMTQHYHVR